MYWLSSAEKEIRCFIQMRELIIVDMDFVDDLGGKTDT
jgi:hypothetical protein